jgi:hypothetical protein
MNFDSRVALTTAAILVAALALVAAPAAADDDDIGIATGDGINSTVDLEVGGNHSGQSGDSMLDCEGQPTHHQCDKGGGVESDAGSVDYTGDNYGDDDDLRAGGGDEVTVASQGEQATGEFDCTLNTSASPGACNVNLTSSQGDAPGPLGENSGSDDGDDGNEDEGGSGGAPTPQDDDVPGSADVEAGVFEGQGLNSTLGFGYEGGQEGANSDGAVDCEGQPSHQQCDKGGSLTAGPAGVDYVGDNYADDDDTRFGGGDEFIVTVDGEELLVGFDCDFTTSPSQETCDFDAGSSQGDAPGQFAPEDGEFDNEGEAPGDERSAQGEANGNDDENRNENAR